LENGAGNLPEGRFFEVFDLLPYLKFVRELPVIPVDERTAEVRAIKAG